MNRFDVGDVVTLGELRKIELGTMLHINYYDEYGALSYDLIGKLRVDDKGEEGYIGDLPFPMIGDDGELISYMDNCGHAFTISKLKSSPTNIK